MKLKKMAQLYISFFKIGGLTFGGGLAMLPMLQREVVENHHWCTEEEILDMYAIGQCTPGIIAVNTATFIGHKLKGPIGGILTTLGVVAPSVVIISIIAAFLQNFADNPYVIHAFNGVRACVCVLILNAVLKLRKSSVIDQPTMVIFLAVFLLSAIWGISPALIVVVAGVIGLALKLMKEKEGNKA